MADAQNEDDQLFILDFADDAVVADAVAPEAAEFGALKGLGEATRIFEFGDALVQKPEDSPRYCAIQHVQSLIGGRG